MIAGFIPGYEQIWIIGDEFLTRAEGHLFNKHPILIGEEDKLYITENFDVKMKASTKLDLNTSVISRIRNQFVKAAFEFKLFPRLVVMVVDIDIISDVKYSGYGISDIYGQMLHWLITEINKVVEIHKDKLPQKSIKANYPPFVWMAPPQNINVPDNILRGKFTQSLKANLEIQENHMMLKPKKIWDYQDSTLFRNGSFTDIGFKTFCKSFDSAIEFWCKHLAGGNKPLSSTSTRLPMKEAIVKPIHSVVICPPHTWSRSSGTENKVTHKITQSATMVVQEDMIDRI